MQFTERASNVLSDLKTWLMVDRLTLKEIKNKIIVFYRHYRHYSTFPVFNLGNRTVERVNSINCFRIKLR